MYHFFHPWSVELQLPCRRPGPFGWKLPPEVPHAATRGGAQRGCLRQHVTIMHT